MKYIGSHISLSHFMNFDNPYIEAIRYIKKYGGNIVEFMLDLSNKKLTNKTILNNCKKYSKNNKVKIVIHASYFYNIAQDWDKYSPSVLSLYTEIKNAYKMGAYCIILHFGKLKNLNKNIAYNNMFTFIIYIHNLTLKYKKTKILLETTAGQGTDMCYLFDELVSFYNKFKKSNNISLRNRIKICVDTCHIFAAGINLSSKKYINDYFNKFDKYIGLTNLLLVHLNDSKSPMGSRKDRHAEINKGYIGKKNLLYIANLCTTYNIPLLVETPNDAFKKEILMIVSNTT
jgi:apurinic endonuclease APN1